MSIERFIGDLSSWKKDKRIANKITRQKLKNEVRKAESEDKLDGDPVDIDKAVEHYEGTLEVLKDIDLEVQDGKN